MANDTSTHRIVQVVLDDDVLRQSLKKKKKTKKQRERCRKLNAERQSVEIQKKKKKKKKNDQKNRGLKNDSDRIDDNVFRHEKQIRISQQLHLMMRRLVVDGAESRRDAPSVDLVVRQHALIVVLTFVYAKTNNNRTTQCELPRQISLRL